MWSSDSTAAMASNGMPAEMATNDTTTQKEYERLQSRVNELSQDIKNKDSQITTLTSALNESQGKVTQIQESLQTPTANNGEFSTWYEQALNKYYAKQYAEAITMFRNVSDQFPNHPLRPNCLYWMGEAEYQLRNFQQAVEMWNLVLQASMSVKKDDALLMLGKTYAQIGRSDDARKALQRLIQEFPTSEYVSKAEAMLTKMQATAMTQ
jgi:tol-pal system protein YbgF